MIYIIKGSNYYFKSICTDFRSKFYFERTKHPKDAQAMSDISFVYRVVEMLPEKTEIISFADRTDYKDYCLLEEVI